MVRPRPAQSAISNGPPVLLRDKDDGHLRADVLAATTVAVYAASRAAKRSWAATVSQFGSPNAEAETGELMKYGIAYLLGVPGILVVAWFLFNQVSC